MIEELERPSAIDDADQAVEVLRAWVADENLQATLDPLAFEEPQVWGLLLADLARHVANTWAEEAGGAPVDAFREIVEAFMLEAQASASVQDEEE